MASSQILYGDKTKTLDIESSQLLYLLIFLLLIPCICVCKYSQVAHKLKVKHQQKSSYRNVLVVFCPSVALIIYSRKQKTMTALMDKHIEDLEFSIRKDIRQGQSLILMIVVI